MIDDIGSIGQHHTHACLILTFPHSDLTHEMNAWLMSVNLRNRLNRLTGANCQQDESDRKLEFELFLKGTTY